MNFTKASKLAIETRGAVVLYRILNEQTGSPQRCLGYELAILSDNGRIKQSWQYEARELRWAKKGIETLIDAQSRNVLAQRDQWKPYSGQRRPLAGSPIAALALADASDVPT